MKRLIIRTLAAATLLLKETLTNEEFLIFDFLFGM